tara:strand:- start:3115 stop:4080 length:966 start_codon:yes stop_codon:yes gene_type:complete
MVDNANIQFMWPINERSYCCGRKYLIRSYSSASDSFYTTYNVINPDTGENLRLKVSESNPNCYISGSLRKWFYGKLAASRDLNKTNLFKCIKLLSELIGISLGILWNGNIRSVELGMSVHLKRNQELIIPSLLTYGRLKRKQIGIETVEFTGTKKSFICYDKLEEVAKKNLSKKIREKLKKNNFILRLEHKIKAPSAPEYAGRVNSLKDIYRNWENLLDNVYFTLKEKVEKDVLFSSDLGLSSGKYTQTEMIYIYAFRGMKTNGMNNVFTFVNSSSKFRSKRSGNRKKLLEIYNTYKSNEGHNILNDIYQKVWNRAEYLKS